MASRVTPEWPAVAEHKLRGWSLLLVRTCQSNIYVADVAGTRAFLHGQLLDVRRRIIEEPGYVAQGFKVDVNQGET